MPLGDIGEGRLEQYLPLSLVRARLAERYTLAIVLQTSSLTTTLGRFGAAFFPIAATPT